MTKIKICGLSDVEAASVAVNSGADFIGMIFASSRRQVDAIKAKQIADAAKSLNNRINIVGVFVNTPAQEVNQAAKFCGLNYVQLSGDESWQYCLEIEKPIIKAIHVDKNHSVQDICTGIEKGYRLIGREKFTCLLDTYSANSYGGTGQTFDWRLAKELSSITPVIVAGGLTTENVTSLVREVRPWGVDVSTGVETNLAKDIVKIRDFIQKVRSAEKERAPSR